MSEEIKKDVYWSDGSSKKGKKLNEEEKKLFGWVFKYLNKKPENDLEKEVQRIYTNLFIF